MASVHTNSQRLGRLTQEASRVGGVLLIGPLPPPRGGISIHILRLARIYEQEGIAYRLLDESRTAKPGVPNLRRQTVFAYFGLLRAADVVHIHTSNRYLRLAHTIFARLMGARVLQTVHGHDSRFFPRLCLRAACRLAHERIAVSDAVSKEIGVPSRVIPAFISPTVDQGKVPADIVRSIADYRASGKKVLALNASRLPQFNGADIYGIDLLMSAFLRSDVRERCGAVVCISDIDQNNAYLHHLRDRLRHNGLNDHILLRVGEIEFAGMLKHCDLFVRPTSTDGDAVSIREALWLGIPTVASDAVARPAGVTTFRSRDANDLARKILQTVSTKEAVAVRSDCYGEQVLETCKGLLKRQCDVE